MPTAFVVVLLLAGAAASAKHLQQLGLLMSLKKSERCRGDWGSLPTTTRTMGPRVTAGTTLLPT